MLKSSLQVRLLHLGRDVKENYIPKHAQHTRKTRTPGTEVPGVSVKSWQ